MVEPPRLCYMLLSLLSKILSRSRPIIRPMIKSAKMIYDGLQLLRMMDKTGRKAKKKERPCS
jgi:hypothetical protein